MYHYTLKRDPYSSHTIIASLIAREDRRPRILDVGCGKGFLPISLGTSFRGTIVGIDCNEQILDQSKNLFTQTYCLDITQKSPLPMRGKFDVIVFGDILEHLQDPLATLQHFSRYLAPDGQIIISVPNVAFWFIRLQLLLGKFDYSDRGILDRTHILFFTQDTARSLLKHAGLQIIEERSTPLPLPLISPFFDVGKPFFFLHQWNDTLARFWPTLFGYQSIFLCRPYAKSVQGDRKNHPA